METITRVEERKGNQVPAAGSSPPPLRLPTYLLQHLARPVTSEEDVDRLVAQIRLAEWRGLL